MKKRTAQRHLVSRGQEDQKQEEKEEDDDDDDETPLDGPRTDFRENIPARQASVVFSEEVSGQRSAGDRCWLFRKH